MMCNRACVILYHQIQDAVLVYRHRVERLARYAGQLDLLGGPIVDGETPEEALSFELAEQLRDPHTDEGITLPCLTLFHRIADQTGSVDHVFASIGEFDKTRFSLAHGGDLVWVTRAEAWSEGFAMVRNLQVALRQFFAQQSKP